MGTWERKPQSNFSVASGETSLGNWLDRERMQRRRMGHICSRWINLSTGGHNHWAFNFEHPHNMQKNLFPLGNESPMPTFSITQDLLVLSHHSASQPHLQQRVQPLRNPCTVGMHWLSLLCREGHRAHKESILPRASPARTWQTSRAQCFHSRLGFPRRGMVWRGSGRELHGLYVKGSS